MTFEWNMLRALVVFNVAYILRFFSLPTGRRTARSVNANTLLLVCRHAAVIALTVALRMVRRGRTPGIPLNGRTCWQQAFTGRRCLLPENYLCAWTRGGQSGTFRHAMPLRAVSVPSCSPGLDAVRCSARRSLLPKRAVKPHLDWWVMIARATLPSGRWAALFSLVLRSSDVPAATNVR